MTKWTRLQKATVLATAAYALVFVLMLIVRPGSRAFYDAFFNTYQIIPPLFAGVVGLVHFHRRHEANRARRFGWLFIALPCLSFAAGQCTWTYLESIKGIQVPFPSWADAGYLGTYVLLITGTLLLFGSMPGVGRARQLLDSAIVASSLGVLSWSFLVEPVWAQSEVSLIGKLISVAYPLGDISALFGAAVLLGNARHSPSQRRSLYFVAAGIVGFTFFDSAFTWMSLHGTYYTGSWADWAVSFGYISIGYAFLSKMWWGSKDDRADLVGSRPEFPARSMWQSATPYLAVVVACAIAAFHDYSLEGTFRASSAVVGMVLLTLVTLRQILALSENRQLTLELEAFSENLERLVAERTEELEIQNGKIVDLMGEKDRFFRHVSHELRTPLTSVIGYTEILMEDQDEPLTDWQRARLEQVLWSGHKLLGIVNDLLDISRVEAGRMDVHLSPVRIDELADLILRNVTPLAAEKHLELRMEVPADLPVVTTDERKLGQILTNLVSNAIKYTHQGSVTISAAQSGDQIAIIVEDTGIGIPEDKHEAIFREFYRVNDGPSRERGSGLGLSVVQRFAKLLGGTVSVQSAQGAGSVFTVTLPITPTGAGHPA